jgi:hypothetical protein
MHGVAAITLLLQYVASARGRAPRVCRKTFLVKDTKTDAIVQVGAVQRQRGVQTYLYN